MVATAKAVRYSVPTPRQGTPKDTLEYHVAHPRWNVWHAENVHVDYNPETLCGLDLAPQLDKPISALVADGSAVTIHWRNRIAA